MNEKIKVGQLLSFDSIEKLYNQLYSIDYKAKTVDIYLPTIIKEENFGTTPLFIQFIATWLRITTRGNLFLPYSVDDILSEGYLKQYFAYVSYQMAQKYRDVKDKNGRSITSSVEDELMEMAALMDRYEGPKRNSVMLTCLDHVANDRGGLQRAFYIDDVFIFDENKHVYLEPLINFIDIHRSNQTQNLLLNHRETLRGIIYELMKNTDDWARTDIDNTILYPNIRGLYLKIHKNFQKNFISNAATFKGLKTYVSHKQFDKKTKDPVFFLEVSVFDGGPGLVRRFLKDGATLSKEDQVSVIQKCLIRNNTSDLSHEKSFRGIGLDRVLKLLDERGLLLVRSSNVFVYRDLIKDRYNGTVDFSRILLNDVKTDLPNNYSYKYNASGTVITIIFPIS